MPKRKPSVLLARMTPKLAEALDALCEQVHRPDWTYGLVDVHAIEVVNAYEDMAEPRPKNMGKWKPTRATVLSDGECGIVHTSAKARVRVAMRAAKKKKRRAKR